VSEPTTTTNPHAQLAVALSAQLDTAMDVLARLTRTPGFLTSPLSQASYTQALTDLHDVTEALEGELLAIRVDELSREVGAVLDGIHVKLGLARAMLRGATGDIKR
jgi:hypothetical protein